MNNPVLSGQCEITGSEGCPCVLANLEECLVCSHLQGLDFCDCSWTKNCVYISFIHDKKSFRPKGENFLVPARFLTVGIRGYHVFLTAPDAVLRTAGPLDCVSIRNRQKSEKTFPAVVLEKYPDHGIISLAVKPLTATEKNILLSSSSFDLIPGSKTAVQGLTNPGRLEGKNVLIASADSGQLLAHALVKRLLLFNVKDITVLLNENLPVIVRKLDKAGVRYQAGNGRSLSEALKRSSFQACFSLGPNSLHKRVAMALISAGSAIPLFISTSCGTNAF